MQPTFLSGADGMARFALHHVPAGAAPRGLVVYLHPFAEEMNKSRRMAALGARALAEAGFAVLQPDLLGCGDSAGEFHDASWQAWLEDACRGAQWLREQHGAAAPLWFWGLRAGCLLAAEAAAQLDEPSHLLFWQPPAAGKALLQQFLRLKMAAELHAGNAAGVTERLREQLRAGEVIEIAGYRLPPALAAGLERAQLRPPARPGCCVWLETSTRDEPSLLPAGQATLTAWRAAGHAVTALAVRGPAFWQTQEIEEAPELVDATVRSCVDAACTPAGVVAVVA